MSNGRLASLARALAGSLLIVIATPLTTHPEPTPAEDPRIMWILMVKPPAEAKRGLNDWVRAYKSFFPSLLAIATDRRSGPSSNLVFDVLDQVVSAADQAELRSSYDSMPSLGAVSANAASDGETTFLDHKVYVGRLKGRLPSPFLHFYNAILPKKYQSSRDAISVVTLYMYAMLLADKKADKLDPYAVCHPLSVANTFVGGLDPQVRTDLHDLLDAITQELGQRKCG